ncbi:MAG: efflux RND transporter periplasmic adaptor subunit [Nitrospina sp.]|nr:efflux RND transporter periplasmic adaptor subunit [Nitrospina sp.]
MNETNNENKDILFPLESMEQKAMLRKKAGLSALRVFLLCALLAGAFLLGFGTRPEVMSQWVEEGREWVQVGIKEIKPIANRMYGKTVAIVDEVHSSTAKPILHSNAAVKKEPGRKIKHWKAPMTPGFISDRPGKSPMGMALVPVYEDEAAGGVSINPTMVQNIGVKTDVVKKRSLSRKIKTIGRLTSDERLIHHIHTKYGGWIEKMYVDFTGQEINKNDVLLEIYSPELVTTQEELILAMKYEESLKDSVFPEIRLGAKRLVDSTLKRLQLFDVPEHQIGALVKNRKVSKTMHIHSPVKGFVVKKNALHGMHVQPGMNLYMIADLSNIWVIADIYEYEVPWVKLGQEAEMNLSYFPGKKFKGKETFIDPILDSKSRTLKVRMEFPNLEGELKPEMYANVTFKSEVAREEMTIPEEAVIYAGDKTTTIVQNSSGTFDSRELTLGVKTQGYVQVLKGLKEGEKVVTSSAFLIDSESRLKEAINKLEEKKVEIKIPAKISENMELILKEKQGGL